MKGGYEITASLYGMNVGGPSSGKSLALTAAAKPLWKIDREMHGNFLKLKSKYDEEMEAYKNASKEDKPTKPVAPVLESAVIDDTTVEALSVTLSHNPRGVLICKDEGSAWVASLGQYKNGKGIDREFYLSAVFGRDIKVSRKGAIEPVTTCIPNPFLSVIGNLPPDLLTTFRHAQGFSDGFLERILFVFLDRRSRPYWSDEGVADAELNAWEAIVRRLQSREMVTSASGPEPCKISLTEEAKVAWRRWYNTLIDGDNSPSSDPGDLASEGKLRDFTARLALILHMLHTVEFPSRSNGRPIPPVSLRAMKGALQLYEYFRSHTERVRAFMRGYGGAGMPGAVRWVFQWLRNHPDQASFAESDVTRTYAKDKAFDKETLTAALRWLRDHDAVRPIQPPERAAGTPGNKPSPRWEIHPDLPSFLGIQGNQGIPATLPGLAGDSAETPESPGAPEDGQVVKSGFPRVMSEEGFDAG